MWGLAIEMSQRDSSIALGRRGAKPALLRLEAASLERDPLMAGVASLTDQLGVRPRDISLIAVSTGPGGFTGLRVATTAAKCMADVLGADLIAVPSALVAASAAFGPQPRLVALAAKRESAWIALVDGEGARVRVIGEPGVRTADEVDWSVAKTLLADRYLPEAMRDRSLAAHLAIEEPTFAADACLAIAWTMADEGRRIEPSQLAPMYPREPEAVALWRERHGG